MHAPTSAAEPARFDDAIPEDERWMQQALELARIAADLDEVPVGAVLVRDGVILAQTFNRMRMHADPTAHAEMEAIRQAAGTLGEGRIVGATLYVTLEPCAMCAGAMVLARIERLVYAATDPKSGMCGSLGCIVQDGRLNHRLRLTRGVRAEEAGLLLRDFFRKRR